MNALEKASLRLRDIDSDPGRGYFLKRIHPLARLWVTLFYIAVVVSFQMYDLSGLLGMSIFLIFLYGLGDLSVSRALYRLRLVLPVIIIFAALNSLFDRSYVGTIWGICVTGGMVSMLSLLIKGLFTVLAVYALVSTTSIEEICCALRLLHVPELFVTVVLLTYRYIFLLLNQAGRMTAAYSLRAPGQKGIRFHAWGSFAGNLLLRSLDRAENVYESMCLRGYHGEFSFACPVHTDARTFLYAAGWTFLILLFRFVPVFALAGILFVKR